MDVLCGRCSRSARPAGGRPSCWRVAKEADQQILGLRTCPTTASVRQPVSTLSTREGIGNCTRSAQTPTKRAALPPLPPPPACKRDFKHSRAAQQIRAARPRMGRSSRRGGYRSATSGGPGLREGEHPRPSSSCPYAPECVEEEFSEVHIR